MFYILILTIDNRAIIVYHVSMLANERGMIVLSSNFGDYIAEKRKELGLSLRGMAEKLEIAAPYLSDIEKGRRNPPNIDTLEKIFIILKLTESERDLLFDYAGKERNEVSPDLPDYIMNTPEARTALRKARDAGKDKEFWKNISNNIDKEDD